MTTVTGEPLELGKKKVSSLQHEKVSVSFAYRESKDVSFPVISMSEASSKGTWLVIGPNTQCLVPKDQGWKLEEALKQSEKVPLLKEKGVYWLEAQQGTPNATPENMIAAPAAREIRAEDADDSALPAQEDAEPLGDAPLGEDPEPEGERGKKARHKKVPPSVSAEVRAEHDLTHLPFRSWCEHCIKGKATEDFHRKREEEKKDDAARYCIDYCFFTKSFAQDHAATKADEFKEVRPESKAVLVCRDQKSGALFAGVANTKGSGDVYSVALALEGLKFCGHPNILLVSDTEPAIRSVADELVKQYPKKATAQPVPKNDPQANGAAERAVLELGNQVRTLKVAFESRYPTVKVTEESVVFPWLVRHAAWLCTRFGVKQDGRTAYERLRNRSYKGEIAEFGEVVMYKISNQGLRKLDEKWSSGVWLGKSLNNDEHFVATADGIQRCRSVRRRVESKRFDPTFVNRMTGLPWQPRGVPERTPLAPGQPLPKTRLEGVVSKPRGVYITAERQIKYGRTPGCPGCDIPYGDAPGKHSPECRERFTKLVEAENKKAEVAPGRPSSGSAGEGLDGSFRDRPPGHGGDVSMGADDGPSGEAQTAAGEGASGRKREASPPEGDRAKEVRFSTSPSESPRSPGRKRGADGPPAEGEEEEFVAGLPTIHVCSIITEEPPDEVRRKYFDERTGEELDQEMVKKGREKEMDKMKAFEVKSDISYEEARKKGLRLVKSRWIDTAKEIEGKPGVRSRLVAQEVNTYKREDVSMGTPPVRVHRAVVSHAATARPGQKESRKLVARYDVSVAFFHADNSEKIGVIPPASEGTPNVIWELHKAMNGTREASRQWGAKIREVSTGNGMSELLLCPNTYYWEAEDLALSCHGDDFLASGERKALDKLDEIMKKNYEVKILPRIGNPLYGGEAKEGKHLGRVIKWTGEGFTWECDPKYSPLVVEELGLQGCKGVDTPASKATGVGNRDAQKELEPQRAEIFRRVAGTILYMSVDRPTLQFAASELAEGMAKPLEIHWLRLKRIGKYIAKFPVERWHFDLQETPSTLESFSDSDWATNKENRRSMSSTYQRFGKHLLDCCCGRQSLVALSSGEAEFYAMVKTAAEGKLTTEILRHFGWQVHHRVLSDSSAARSMAQRVGCGKVKHLSLKQMWIQQAVRTKELSIGKVDTLMNLADLGTKALESSRLDSLVKQLPLERGLLAAVVASCLTMAQATEGQGTGFLVTVDWYLIVVHVLALVGLWFLMVKASGLVLSFGRSLSRGLQGWGGRPEPPVDLDAMARRRSSSTGVESSGEQRDSASVAHRRSSSTAVESSGEQRDSASVVSSSSPFSGSETEDWSRRACRRRWFWGESKSGT